MAVEAPGGAFVEGGASGPGGAEFAGIPEPACVSSETGKSCRRTGSLLGWNLEARAGVFMNAPGTGRTGVVCGNDISGNAFVYRCYPEMGVRCVRSVA